MDSVGKLLQHTGPDQATHTAALVVATVNAVLQERVGVLVRDARATSFQQGTIRIHVSHGAVAGQLNQRAEEILELCNNSLARLGASRFRIQRIQTRVTGLPPQ